MLQLPVYLDYSATTPCDARVLETMLPYFTKNFGNASSRSHAFGWKAQTAVEGAQKAVASLIGADPREIIFTSGSTEGCNLALRGVYEMYATKGNHIITTATEHKAVLDTCRFLQKKGAEITFLKVLKDGTVDLEALKASIKPQTILIAVMYANNETSVIQPIKEIGAIARQHNVLFFSDATQAVGKVPVNVQSDAIDLLALSAHKMYGPKGAGALFVKRRDPRVKLTPQITGGGQQNDVRSGTLNVPGIVGLGKACEICADELQTGLNDLKQLRNHLQGQLLQIEASYLNGSESSRLPHICNISFKSLSASQLLSVLNKTLAVSSGSACTSGSLDPSYVLKAMGIEDGLARGAIRFSLGRFTTREEVDFAVQEVTKAVEQLRSNSFEWQLFKSNR